MSVFTAKEIEYLTGQPLGRLGTVQRSGVVQVSPVGFRYVPELDVIDIDGYNMSKSQKYRNVLSGGQATITIDDLVSTNPWRIRCLEIRGVAEALNPPGPGEPDRAFIRIHPQRIIGLGVEDPAVPPHQLVANARNV